MPNLSSIKDTTPNQDAIDMLEGMLEKAKSGELRSFVAIRGWEDDSWSTAWQLDIRNTRFRLYGIVSLMQHELLTNAQLADKDSVLNYALDG